MRNQDFQPLLLKYLSGTCSEQERQLLEQWYLDWNAEGLPVDEQLFTDAKAEVFSRLPIHAKQAAQPKNNPALQQRILAAAAVLFILLTAAVFFVFRSNPTATVEIAQGSIDLPAGKNGAQLTLPGGKRVTLSGAQQGVAILSHGLEYLDGSAVDATADQLLGSTEKGQTFTASTSMGQSYKFTLPDGTIVWLNAASSISFPGSFDPKGSRMVSLSGEGYFQVSKKEGQPFIVSAGNQKVEVLGTHFNINSYENEATVETTLLEGSVRISHEAGSRRDQVTLVPGQQASSTKNNVTVRQVDAQKAIDWQRGDFEFETEALSSIMRKIARWYDVKVLYQEGVDQNQTFSGTVTRQKRISEVLDIMQTTGQLRFKIEGRQVTVMK
ncbi:FecR family protein [Pedobacter sp. GR22-6]|uniref:FecR family protein n=1 Tax=Pedobacter sp. GR22-6 TaxID=3127957 RepID=UPI00307F1EAA